MSFAPTGVIKACGERFARRLAGERHAPCGCALNGTGPKEGYSNYQRALGIGVYSDVHK